MQQSCTRTTSITQLLGLIGLQAIEPVILSSLATHEPLLVLGTHGSGKSLLLERVAQALRLEWRYYNASLVNFDDLVGYPLPDVQGKLRFVETPASIWGAEAVFIDEIARARVDIQNRLFPVIHEKRVQGIPLEKLRYRWAAMNPPATDDDDEVPYAGSHPLDVALADRFAFHIRMPDWRQFDAAGQEAVIRAYGNAPTAGAGDELGTVLDRIRNSLRIAEVQWSGPVAQYVRLLAGFLEEAGRVISARRAGMLARNILSVHAARLVLVNDAEIGDSAWLAALSSMPFVASGLRLDEAKLLACHKEAWRMASMEPDDVMGAILGERDLLKRVKLAYAAKGLPEGEMTTIVTDALQRLEEGSRHALAEWLFESHAVERLSVVAADTAAQAYREVACVQDICEQVAPNSQRHKVWKSIHARLGMLDREDPSSERIANLLTALFADNRLAQEATVDSVLAAYTAARRQLAGERV